MKLPITLIDNGGDRESYSSVEPAELAMEAIDVENGEYLAVDADGQALVIQVVEQPLPILFGLLCLRIKKMRIQLT